VAAIVYGVVVHRWISRSRHGNDAHAARSPRPIQAGAKAYLNRQYTTIAIVGVVLFVAHRAWRWAGLTRRSASLIGAVLSGVAGFIGMNVVGARQRAHRRGRATSGLNAGAARRVPRRRHHRHAGRRASALLGVAGYFGT
jgi:K(+)-stimulated pyrophosphate-energized sodium pump